MAAAVVIPLMISSVRTARRTTIPPPMKPMPVTAPTMAFGKPTPARSRELSRHCRQVLASVPGRGLHWCRARVSRSFGPLNSQEYGEEDRMTTVTAKPAEEERHRLPALEDVAALSLDVLLSVVYGPGVAALPARQLGAGS